MAAPIAGYVFLQKLCTPLVMGEGWFKVDSRDNLFLAGLGILIIGAMGCIRSLKRRDAEPLGLVAAIGLLAMGAGLVTLSLNHMTEGAVLAAMGVLVLGSKIARLRWVRRTNNTSSATIGLGVGLLFLAMGGVFISDRQYSDGGMMVVIGVVFLISTFFQPITE